MIESLNGLIQGERFRIYNLQGQPVYQGKATATEEHVPLHVLAGTKAAHEAAEQITIYSPTGALLFRVQKGVGEAVYRIDRLPKGVLII
ncbi:MAG: hypothetical protein LBB84_03695 [Tannerellaceae bacterium]|jgi:hypothetical protein|nr:hypothetical protein [Tannerellaceae bacterium]